MHTIALVFLDIAIIMLVARLMGRLAIAIGQPPVVGEIVAGIMMGPSLLGLLPGNLDEKLFPSDVLSHLSILAQLGLVLFMFIVGLELDLSLIRGKGKVASGISIASVTLPFLMALPLAYLLHPRHDVVDGNQVEFYALALFLGVSMAITAFPVLARILTDRGMHRTPTGVLALACAAVDDILAWTLLAFVVAIVRGNGPGDVIRIVALTLVFAAVMFLVVRPLLARLVGWYQKAGRLSPDILAVVLIGVLASAFATDLIGIHAIFGAFIFGAVMPRTGAAAELNHAILERLEQVSVLLLLPLFFVVTGLGTDIGGINVGGLWQLALILFVAIAGKFVAAYLAARSMRVPNRQASAIGILMNTRGLTELVILQVGRELGVLDPELFTLLVLMALITTAMTGPLLKLAYPDRLIARDVAAAERAALGIEDAYRVLAVVDRPVDAKPLIALGGAMLGGRQPSQLVLTRLLPRSPKPLELGTPVAMDLAQMATAVDELNQAAAALGDHGLNVTAQCRFSSDPWADLTSLAEISAARIVVVDRAWWEQHGGAFDAKEHPFSLVIVDLGDTSDDGALSARPGTAVPGTPDARPDLLVLAEGDPNGRAALLCAAAMARSGGQELQVALGGQRAKHRLSGALRTISAAIPTAVIEPDGALPDASVVIRTEGSPPVEPGSATVLTLRAGGLDTDADPEEAAAELVTPAG